LVLSSAAFSCLATPTIKVSSGNAQHTPYALPFALPFTVQVTDSVTAHAVAGVQVLFGASSGIGISSSTAVTDSNGFASVTGSGLAAGFPVVQAQISGNPKIVTFNGLSVTKVPLTITPANLSSIIGVVPPLTSYTLLGFVNGETPSSAGVTGAPALTTVATASSIANSYGIKSAVGTLAAANYSFVAGIGKLTLVGLPTCGKTDEINLSSWLHGTYDYNLYNQQGGYTGVMTADGVSHISGQAVYNQTNTPNPVLSSFSGIYKVGNGERGGLALLQSTAGVTGPPQVTLYCVAVDHIVNGVATSGRLIAANNAGLAEAGSFYLVDGSVTSTASLQGTYVVGLQGTGLDLNTGTPLQSLAMAAITLDGSGNVTGLADVEDNTLAGGQLNLEYNPKLPVTGTYAYDSGQGGGLLTLNYMGIQANFAMVAPTAQHVLLMTADSSTNSFGNGSSEPIYFGEAKLRAPGAITTATLQGNLNMRVQGVDPMANEGQTSNVQAGVIAEAGGFFFDGISTFKAQGLFNTLDGKDLTSLDYSVIQSTLNYTVDPVSGRFESTDVLTNDCVVCGYIVGPNELDAVITQVGLPLFATFEQAVTGPGATKISDLNGAYSVGSMALITPLVASWEGVLRCDGKGNFAWAADEEVVPTGLSTNLSLTGTYTAAGGAYALTINGDSSPDFYVYLDTNGQGTMIPFNAATTANLPMLQLSAATPPGVVVSVSVIR
jgi:hypothetical protein